MINIEINGEKVIITEKTNLKNLYALDAYVVDEGDRVAVIICNTQTDSNFSGQSINNLAYVAGIIIADKTGDIETVTDKIIYEGLSWDNSLMDWRGVYIKGGNYDELNGKAGIKVFFGRC